LLEETMTRTFETTPAVRSQVPLLVGLVSPSGAGKTYSALRLATGIQRVVGGEIFVADTESRRSLHYADTFKFQFTPFVAPFAPLDYLAVIEHCVSKGAKTIILDSMSHEHEGPGGVLEMHEREIERMIKEWGTSREKVQLGAWARPKQDRRRLINSLLQIPCNFILCFRAKRKLKVEPGKPPRELGWMPIAGDEWIYEMTMNCLLMPNAGGVPTWDPAGEGEQDIIKLPEQFKSLMLDKQAGKPLSEETGQALAVWAAGDAATATEADYEKALAAVGSANSSSELKKTAEALRSKSWTDEQRAGIAAAIEATKSKIGKAA
jgi:hypothetical protein